MSPDNRSLPILGFIGTGTITTALVTAFCKDESRPYPIIVSPLYEKNAAYLKATFPDQVTVAQSLQEVADKSDWLVLAVLPQAGEEVCRSIKFRRDHKVINLLTDKTLPQIKSWIGETEILVHMVPLSFVATQRGPIIIHPFNPEVEDLITPIGEPIFVADRYHAAVLAVVTGFVASFFTLEESIVNWAAAQGVPADTAKAYVTEFFRALSNQGCDSSRERLRDLAEEMTPGGINYMAKVFIEERDGFKLWIDSLADIMARLAQNIPH